MTDVKLATSCPYCSHANHTPDTMHVNNIAPQTPGIASITRTTNKQVHRRTSLHCAPPPHTHQYERRRHERHKTTLRKQIITVPHTHTAPCDDDPTDKRYPLQKFISHCSALTGHCIDDPNEAEPHVVHRDVHVSERGQSAQLCVHTLPQQRAACTDHAHAHAHTRT